MAQDSSSLRGKARKIRSALLGGACILAAAAGPLSAKPRSGIVSTHFDGKPSGARFIGLGEAGTAVSGMPESPLWNPAALTDVESSAFSMDFDIARQSVLGDDILLQNAPLRGRKLTYLGFAGNDGAFFYRPMANFNSRLITDPADPANNFIDESVKINQFGFSGSQEDDKSHALGITLSYLNASRGYARAAAGQPPVLEMADGNGFSMDLGMRAKLLPEIAGGLAFFNIPGILYWNRYKADQLPVLMRAGLAFQPVPVFTLVTDYEKRFYRGGLPRPDSLHLGLEIRALPWLELRGGTYGEDLSDAEKTFYSAGFSVFSAKTHRIDMALRSYRVMKERVTNYFLSILLPIPADNTRQ